jgi:hypothetical protein
MSPVERPTAGIESALRDLATAAAEALLTLLKPKAALVFRRDNGTRGPS